MKPVIHAVKYGITCLFALAALAITACTPAKQTLTPERAFASKPVYNYPINNAYAATIITTPPEMQVDYSALPEPEEKTIPIFPGRKIAEGFWYEDGLKYSQLLQKSPAPLVYVIAGTGADSKSQYMRLIGNILYSAGYSVVLLPSPTNPDFVINASENFTPGRQVQDAKDLYRVMKRIDPTIQAQQRMLVGYSLGAMNAIFTAKLDDQEQAIRFRKVLLINPPLDLRSSVMVLDNYLYRALPQGVDGADRFIKTLLARLSSVSQSTDALDFSNERMLLEAYNHYQPSDNRLATTVGLSFRLSAADMIFTADVMCHCGYIFPKNEEFTTATPLNNYLSVALRTSFQNYFDELYARRWLAIDPTLTHQQLLEENNLQQFADYISRSGKIYLITNRDDIILAPGEIKTLASLFGDHAAVFPNGGHLGNLGHPAVGYQIIQFLKQ